MNSSAAADGILLAGGASTRMGRPKALLPVPGTGRTLLEDQLARLTRVGCARVVCVLGADAERIAGSLDSPVWLCRNHAWELGPFSSLQAGLQALDPSPGGAILLPLDVPGVGAPVFARLLEIAAGQGPAAAVIPTYQERGGHPIWIAPGTIAAILSSPPEARLDHLLRERNCMRFPVGDARVRGNINTPEDWERYCASLTG